MASPPPNLVSDRARVFKALGHPVRLQIVEALERDGEACVCHLEHRLGLRQAYLSQHLARLRAAGIVTDRRSGANVFYALAGEWVSSAASLVPPTTIPHSPGANLAPGRQRKARKKCPCPRCSNASIAAATPTPALPLQGEGRVGVDPQANGQHRRSEAR